VAAIPQRRALFVVATPARTVCDDNARALDKIGALRFIALGTRRGTRGIPPERTRRLPAFGLANYVMAGVFSPSTAESLRLRMHPWFDRWVLKQLQPGDHILSSYGYANECFKFVRRHGGKTLVDAGNSHPGNFRDLLAEEHRRWRCPLPPGPRHWLERSLAMMEHVDYVLSPSSYVTQSFLARGFRPEQILRNIYPVDLSCFSPATGPRPAARPLTLICTGSLSLRKGTPYLLDAFRLVRKQIPDARLLLTRAVMDDARPVLDANADLPVEWSPPLPHPQLAERLRGADIFILPSLEEGLARTACEAMACGLPVIVTPHTGANDFVQPGVNGEVVPIRDAPAMANAILKWAEKIFSGRWQPPARFDLEPFTFGHFEREFLEQLRRPGLAGPG